MECVDTLVVIRLEVGRGEKGIRRKKKGASRGANRGGFFWESAVMAWGMRAWIFGLIDGWICMESEEEETEMGVGLHGEGSLGVAELGIYGNAAGVRFGSSACFDC